MRVLIKGAGVAGLTLAYELAAQEVDVEVAEVAAGPGGGASWYAGGMLAPWCEGESASDIVMTLGCGAADWWDAALPGHVVRNGTLVVAPPRDTAELSRFAARTSGFEWLEADDIAVLEPALAGRFRKALFFSGEAHLDPRRTIASLHAKLTAMDARFHFGADAEYPRRGFDHVVDCTGANAVGAASELRGVRGEMLMLETADIELSRPVRLLHPRIPLYIVPRGGNRFMVGATMIESDDPGPVSVRSVMELLNAVYAVHPAFGEARLVETGAGVRPAYPDNLPRWTRDGDIIRLNGLYRHGFLLAPSLTGALAAEITGVQSGNSPTRLPSPCPAWPTPDQPRQIGASR